MQQQGRSGGGAGEPGRKSNEKETDQAFTIADSLRLPQLPARFQAG